MLLAEQPGEMRLWAWGALHILIWLTTPKPHSIAMLRQGLERRARESEEPYSTVLVISAGASLLPGKEARRQLLALRPLVQSRTGLVSCAVVIEHQGLLASAIRAVVTSILSSFSQRGVVYLSGSIEPAVRWLALTHTRLTGTPVDALGLAAALRCARYRSEHSLPSDQIQSQ